MKFDSLKKEYVVLLIEYFSLTLHPNNKSKVMQDVNRLKLVLVEQKKTSKWLSEELGVSPSTVSKWCTNSSQPDIETLSRISKLLNVGVEELFNKKFLESVSNRQNNDIELWVGDMEKGLKYSLVLFGLKGTYVKIYNDANEM